MLELAHEAGRRQPRRGDRAGRWRALRKELEEFELKVMLSGPHDAKTAVLSIHPGAGGTESQDWAQMLDAHVPAMVRARGASRPRSSICCPARRRGSSRRRSRSAANTPTGSCEGEAGVHRLVRISPFDASRRRQTSFASVAVVPEVDDVEVTIREDEIRVDVFRVLGARRAGRQYRRLGRPHHAPADEHRRPVSERALPAAQPRHRAPHPQGPALRDRPEEAEGGAGGADRRKEGDRLRQPDPLLHVSSLPAREGPPHRGSRSATSRP